MRSTLSILFSSAFTADRMEQQFGHNKQEGWLPPTKRASAAKIN